MMIAMIQVLVCVVLITLGQVLLKGGMTGLESVVAAIYKPSIWAALALYGFGMLIWLDVLRRTPLYMAYPLMALSFVIVPLLGAWLLGEPLRISVVIGGIIVVIGVAVSYWPEFARLN